MRNLNRLEKAFILVSTTESFTLQQNYLKMQDQIHTCCRYRQTSYLSHIAEKFVLHSYIILFRALSYSKTLYRPKRKKIKVQISLLNFQIQDLLLLQNKHNKLTKPTKFLSQDCSLSADLILTAYMTTAKSLAQQKHLETECYNPEHLNVSFSFHCTESLKN